MAVASRSSGPTSACRISACWTAIELSVRPRRCSQRARVPPFVARSMRPAFGRARSVANPCDNLFAGKEIGRRRESRALQPHAAPVRNHLIAVSLDACEIVAIDDAFLDTCAAGDRFGWALPGDVVKRIPGR